MSKPSKLLIQSRRKYLQRLGFRGNELQSLLGSDDNPLDDVESLQKILDYMKTCPKGNGHAPSPIVSVVGVNIPLYTTPVGEWIADKLKLG